MPIITLLKICMEVLKWNLNELLLLKKQDAHKHINMQFFFPTECLREKWSGTTDRKVDQF